MRIYISFDDFKFILYSDRRRESVQGRGGEFLGKKRETSKERRFENENIGKERRETVNGGCGCARMCGVSSLKGKRKVLGAASFLHGSSETAFKVKVA